MRVRERAQQLVFNVRAGAAGNYEHTKGLDSRSCRYKFTTPIGGANSIVFSVHHHKNLNGIDNEFFLRLLQEYVKKNIFEKVGIWVIE